MADHWMIRYNLALEYACAHKKNVPQHYVVKGPNKEVIELGKWFQRQRFNMRCTSPDRYFMISQLLLVEQLESEHDLAEINNILQEDCSDRNSDHSSPIARLRSSIEVSPQSSIPKRVEPPAPVAFETSLLSRVGPSSPHFNHSQTKDRIKRKSVAFREEDYETVNTSSISNAPLSILANTAMEVSSRSGKRIPTNDYIDDRQLQNRKATDASRSRKTSSKSAAKNRKPPAEASAASATEHVAILAIGDGMRKSAYSSSTLKGMVEKRQHPVGKRVSYPEKITSVRIDNGTLLSATERRDPPSPTSSTDRPASDTYGTKHTEQEERRGASHTIGYDHKVDERMHSGGHRHHSREQSRPHECREKHERHHHSQSHNNVNNHNASIRRRPPSHESQEHLHSSARKHQDSSQAAHNHQHRRHHHRRHHHSARVHGRGDKTDVLYDDLLYLEDHTLVRTAPENKHAPLQTPRARTSPPSLHHSRALHTENSRPRAHNAISADPTRDSSSSGRQFLGQQLVPLADGRALISGRLAPACTSTSPASASPQKVPPEGHSSRSVIDPIAVRRHIEQHILPTWTNVGRPKQSPVDESVAHSSRLLFSHASASASAASASAPSDSTTGESEATTALLRAPFEGENRSLHNIPPPAAEVGE